MAPVGWGHWSRAIWSSRKVSRDLLLVSRRGLEAEGAKELQDSLGELGVEVRVAACDVSDRAQLKTLIDSVPDEYPLRTIIHAAGAFDAGSIESLDSERLDAGADSQGRRRYQLA